MITKKTVLQNLEDCKKFINEIESTPKVEQKVVGLAIKNRWTGSIIFQSTKITYKEAVIERLANSANLSGANLSGANLRDADFSGTDLSHANLRDANLRDANLSGANLRDADLSGTDLSHANLRDANLRGADLSDANLRDAEMQNVKFYGRGGTKELRKSQLPDFLGALGFIIVD